MQDAVILCFEGRDSRVGAGGGEGKVGGALPSARLPLGRGEVVEGFDELEIPDCSGYAKMGEVLSVLAQCCLEFSEAQRVLYLDRAAASEAHSYLRLKLACFQVFSCGRQLVAY